MNISNASLTEQVLGDISRNWGWTLAAGISGIILGVMLYSEWPVSGLFAIGLFVSIR